MEILRRLLRLTVLLSLCVAPAVARANPPETTGEQQSAVADTLHAAKEKRGGHHLRNKFLDGLYSFVKEFSRIDTNYVEPQHYNFQLMLQNTYSFDMYSLRNENGQEVEFKQSERAKVGPYFGWRWIFLGYMVDLKGSVAEGQQDYGLSLYSNQIGVDLFYRRSGESYVVNSIDLGDGQDLSYLEGVPFDGFNSSIKGFNLYYIFNHRKFSYPAAYSMSTMQKRSLGSEIAGVGSTTHTHHAAAGANDEQLQEYMGENYYHGIIDSTLANYDISYTDYSVSAGYAYNWVVAPRFLVDISLQGALAYKRTTSHSDQGAAGTGAFSIKNFNLDGILRVGCIYNNNKWFVGANSIIHAYNYNRKQFSASTIFGNINIYIGFNFWRR